MSNIVPKCTIVIAFATGKAQISSKLTKPELMAKLDLTNDVEPVVILRSTDTLEVRENPRDPNSPILHVLENEDVVFRKKDIVFFSINEVCPPPKIELLKPILHRE